jgi:hypothetical protein
MMGMATMLNQLFFQVSLPIMVTILIAGWAHAKGFDGVNRRLDDVIARLGRIEDRLLGLETRFSALERKVDALELKAWR